MLGMSNGKKNLQGKNLKREEIKDFERSINYLYGKYNSYALKIETLRQMMDNFPEGSEMRANIEDEIKELSNQANYLIQEAKKEETKLQQLRKAAFGKY